MNERNTPEHEKEGGYSATPRQASPLKFSIENILKTPTTPSPSIGNPLDLLHYQLWVSFLTYIFLSTSSPLSSTQTDAMSSANLVIHKKPRTFTPYQVYLMKVEFQKDPYPTYETRSSLSERTGLSEAQVYNWFTCERKRVRKEQKRSSSGAASGNKSR